MLKYEIVLSRHIESDYSAFLMHDDHRSIAISAVRIFFFNFDYSSVYDSRYIEDILTRTSH